MFRRFGHGHSTVIGFVFAVLLMRHALVFALSMLAVGFVLGRAWLVWARVGYAARRYFDRRANNLKARGRARLSMLRHDDIPF